MKMVTIVGARPQFIKAAAVSRAIVAHNRSHSGRAIREVIVHSGQHHDVNMSEIFFREMEIPAPDHALSIHGLGHGAMTGRMLERIESVLLEERPDLVLVYGDTNTTLAGALAAVKLHLPVAHVEAGLRSFNRMMPEEINRILTDHVATWLLCPTPTAVRHLHDEGLHLRAGMVIRHCGDVMFDTIRHFAPHARDRAAHLRQGVGDGYRLCTLHRAELTDNDERLRQVFDVLLDLASSRPMLMPLHPRTRNALQRIGLNWEGSGLRVIEPVGYLEMIDLLDHAGVVITDSGGLQKEAFFMGKGCVTVRAETEWTELVEIGCNQVTGFDAHTICQAVVAMQDLPVDPSSCDIYGHGDASERILKTLLGE
ncbi:MAG: UDP-N-acetylglucosamine 2-epimerase (non-hydrolyzing) [Magnetococcales bacterium]|nr:UDP-N-acetylglucosamine 2-epimerase (non-hydrolyzing) [Magnetococcales bacterium]NGZ05107.1 UDP-N-acetylglucosamine 2-epimerase (non-hydrolyzing) [Magnetococcales bacterium]